jgi:peptidoglycan/xylan/chitin deacetylase (PgdA/CDA1 family)
MTFDDGDMDFATYAWPRLRAHGFGAIVLVVTGSVGKTSHWTRPWGEELQLLDWTDIERLHDEGVEFGAHSRSHPHLTTLAPPDIVCETAISRMELTQRLGAPPRSFAYPFGDTDHVVRHLTGAVGFTYGFTCEGRPATCDDALIALPRIEVRGDADLGRFAASLSRCWNGADVQDGTGIVAPQGTSAV